MSMKPILTDLLPSEQYDLVQNQHRIALAAIAHLPSNERLAAIVVVHEALDCNGSAASQMAALEAVTATMGALIFEGFRK